MNQLFVANHGAKTSAEKIAGDATNTTKDGNGQRIQCERHTGLLEITPQSVGSVSLSHFFSSVNSPSRLITLTAKGMKAIASRLTAKIISKDILQEISSLLRGLKTQ